MSQSAFISKIENNNNVLVTLTSTGQNTTCKSSRDNFYRESSNSHASVSSLRKVPRNYETHSLCRVSGESPETLRKLCVSAKFSHQSNNFMTEAVII